MKQETLQRIHALWAIVLLMTAAALPDPATAAQDAALNSAPPGDANAFAAEFAKLEEEMERAYEAYVESVRKRGEGNGESAAKPSEAEPADPRLEVLARMDALVELSSSSPDAGDIAVKTFIWSAAFRLDPQKLLERFDRVARHANHRDVGDAVALVVDVHSRDGSPQDWVERLTTIARKATLPAVSAAATFATGQIHLEAAQEAHAARGPDVKTDHGKTAAEQLAKAKSAFTAVSALDSDSEYIEAAKGYIYEIENLQPGMPAPLFIATTLSGETISLADYRGKVVLLDIWATWCPPCLAEAPTLKAAAERFSSRPFAIIGVSLDDFREMLESTLQQKELPGVHTWDEAGRENPVAEKYHAENLPTWYLIDQQGIIRARNPFGEKLVPAVEQLLANSR